MANASVQAFFDWLHVYKSWLCCTCLLDGQPKSKTAPLYTSNTLTVMDPHPEQACQQQHVSCTMGVCRCTLNAWPSVCITTVSQATKGALQQQASMQTFDEFREFGTKAGVKLLHSIQKRVIADGMLQESSYRCSFACPLVSPSSILITCGYSGYKTPTGPHQSLARGGRHDLDALQVASADAICRAK